MYLPKATQNAKKAQGNTEGWQFSYATEVVWVTEKGQKKLTNDSKFTWA